MNIIRFFKSKPKALNSNWTTDLLKSVGIQQFLFDQEANQTYRANFEVLKRRQKIWLENNKFTPQEVIKSTIPYIKGLLELAKTFHPKTERC